VALRVERGLKIVVVGAPVDAKASPGLGRFPSHEEGFEDDLMLIEPYSGRDSRHRATERAKRVTAAACESHNSLIVKDR
jgi:hypothetical protein